MRGFEGEIVKNRKINIKEHLKKNLQESGQERGRDNKRKNAMEERPLEGEKKNNWNRKREGTERQKGGK